MIELRAPLHATIEISTQCQYNCLFCQTEISKHGLYTGPTASFDEFKLMIKKLVIEKVRVFLSGGEPTLNPDLSKLISYGIGLGGNICTSTNAVAVTEKMAKDIYDAGLHAIQVSLQGTEPFNNRLVSHPGGFKKALQGIKNLVKAGIRVEVTTVGTKINWNNIPELIPHLKEAGVSFYRILRLMTFSKEALTLRIKKKDIIEGVKKIQSAAMKYDLPTAIASPPVEISSREWPVIQYPFSFVCDAGKTKFEVTADGSVLPCFSLRSPKFICGNLITDSVDQIWNAEPMLELRYLTYKDYTRECGNCEYKNNCYSCRSIAYFLDGTLEGDDISCYFLNPPS